MILIVEDNPNMRSMMKSLLADTGSEFCEADDGIEALRVFTQHRPDWVLMDVKMREVDGITATRQIKASFPQARIVIVSHYDDPELKLKAFEAGALAYVLKDDLSVLLDIIKRGSVSPRQ